MLDSHQRDVPAADQGGGWSPYLTCPTKRAFDLVLGLLLVALFLPALMVTALLVKVTSPGPVFFRQWRTGLDGVPFQIVKFRTMSVLEEGKDPIRQATRGDSRVTPLGAWLRKLSIDELPQLLNVIAGEMSLVGPRPHAICHDEAFAGQVENYLGRFAARPGMTGLAQVRGARGEISALSDLQRRTLFDLAYIGESCLIMDLRILFATFAEIFFSRTAY
ncbi:sugar transferase [Faunimonas pinastri]|uniref:sugar transferase n=1 Tax=Faunimonas pinastri TaxID=1855383 RepID=UPI0015A6B048|nr:sugar transferase [Faunimonas pinastri]